MWNPGMIQKRYGVMWKSGDDTKEIWSDGEVG